jgi:hypothetical protein
MTPEIRRELGAKRSEVTYLIRHEMRKRGYTDVSFARDVAGVSFQVVGRTLRGFGHSPNVLDGLRRIGIPEKLLFDPRKIIPEFKPVK